MWKQVRRPTLAVIAGAIAVGAGTPLAAQQLTPIGVSYQPAVTAKDGLASQFAEFGELLGMLARKFICSYVKVMDKAQWIPSDVKLSKREIECLRWAAVGKTDSEVALILGRSCATIRFHIHNAAQKLNAVNRSQAVFKAGQLGYLGSVS